MAKMGAWEQEGFDKLIEEMKVKGIDVSEYMSLNYYKLLKINKAISNSLDVTKIYRKGYKGLSEAQMDSVINGMKIGINTDIYNRKDIKADIMDDVLNEMRKAKNIGLSSANIDKIGLDALKDALDKEKTKKAKPLTPEQQKYIDRMKTLGVDTLALDYEKNTMKPGILKEITLGYEHGVDVSQYYRKGYKLREWQCKEIRLALEAGIDPTTLNDKDKTPEEMANIRLWLQCTTEEQRKIAESIDIKYQNNTILRRVMSLKEANDNIDLIPDVMRETPSKISYYLDEEYIYIFRALLLISLPEIKTKQVPFVSLIDDLDNYYVNLDKEYNNLSAKLRKMDYKTDEYKKLDNYIDYQYRQEKMNQFFIDNIGKNLKELFDEFEKQEPKTENRMYGNKFTEFKECYLGEKTETMFDKWA